MENLLEKEEKICKMSKLRTIGEAYHVRTYMSRVPETFSGGEKKTKDNYDKEEKIKRERLANFWRFAKSREKKIAFCDYNNFRAIECITHICNMPKWQSSRVSHTYNTGRPVPFGFHAGPQDLMPARMAVAEKHLAAEAAWDAAHVDEDWQAAHWGRDAEAAARQERRRQEFSAAAKFLALAEGR